MSALNLLKSFVSLSRQQKETWQKRRRQSQRRWNGLELLEQRALMAGDVAGTLIHDLNDNGAKDSGEEGLPGWTLFIDLDNSGTLSSGDPTEVTNVDGDYLFTDIPAGNQVVYEVLPMGWEPTAGALDHQTVLVKNGDEVKADFFNNTAQVGSIEGIVWNDSNGNGTQDATEIGLAGWTIFLDDDNDGVQSVTEPGTTTAIDGTYAFPIVRSGTHRVREVLPVDWVPSEGFDPQYNINVTTGNTTVVDFYNLIPEAATISGAIVNDLNGTGFSNPANPGLAGWQVYADTNNDGSYTLGEPSATSDTSGSYTLSGIVRGTVTIREEVQAGYVPTNTVDGSRVITLLNGDVITNFDFLNMIPTPGSITGRVWSDADSNGIIGASEVGIDGWQVYADLNSDGSYTTGEPTATTGVTGAYTLSGISRGLVTIRDVIQPGWTATFPSTSSIVVNLLNGENRTGVNFGNHERAEATISGVVFADSNKNGTRDPGEKGLAGISVYLDINNNGSLDVGEPSTLSSIDLYYTPAINEAGNYSFDRLTRGTYHVREILPVELSATPSTVSHQVVSLGPADVTNLHFANVYRANEIHGSVFDDIDGDKVHDLDEPSRAGVTVYIDLDRDDSYDPEEPSELTDASGSYTFGDLTPGAYVVRQIITPEREHSYPNTTGGTLWPTGVSNPAVGNVTPTNITTSLSTGQNHRLNVSLTLPGSGGLTNLVDVFLLFDDTGSFTANSPIVRAAFPTIISTLQASLPGIDLGFGVGRFEEYANFASEYGTGRPFILNQPIVASSTPGFSTSIQAALDRTAPGYGGDQPETDIEALFQLVTGRGFDGNNNGVTTDSGAAGLYTTQVTPGNSGDVPAFNSFTADPANNVLPAAGTVGGGGFRPGALPVILTATDTGFNYQPKGETTIIGAGGVSLPLSALTQLSRATTPYNSGAGIQETVTGLNALGALVIGLGTNPEATLDPRQQLESLAKLTGSINRTTTSIPNGTTNPIDPGDPFYFQISSGFGGTVATGVVNAIQNAVTNVAMDITLQASDPRVHIINHTGTVLGIGSGQTATFDVEFVGDGIPHRFDLQFVRAGTNVVLGSIPVVLGTPVPGDCYDFTELEDGEIEVEVEFGDHQLAVITNQAPTDIVISVASIAETAANGALVGTFTTTDPDAGDTFTYALVSGTGSADNAAFSIVNNELHTNTTLDFLTQSSYAIRVASTDNGGLSVEKEFTVTVTDVNTAPSLVVTGPTDGFSGVRGQVRTFHLAVSDDVLPSSSPTLSFDINWGDGSPAENVTGGLTLDVSHIYANTGTFTPSFQATDAGLLSSSAATASDTILATELQGYTFAIGGTGGADTFTLTPSSTTAQIVTLLLNGLNLGPITVPTLGLSIFGGTGTDNLIFNGTALAETFSSSDALLDWSGVTPWTAGFSVAKDAIESQRINSLAGEDVLTVSSGNTIYDGGTGNDQLNAADSDNAWQITGTNTGTLNSAAWFNAERLTGGAGNDYFAIGSLGRISGLLNGGGGNDSLDYSLLATAVTVNLQTNTASNVVGLQNVEQFLGSSSSTDNFYAANIANNWQVNAVSNDTLLNSTTTLRQFELLRGGSAVDTFKITPAISSGPALYGNAGIDTLDYTTWSGDLTLNLEASTATGLALINTVENYLGGSGANTIIGSHFATTWGVSGPNSGKVGAATFSNFASLVGGTGNDIFTFSSTGSVGSIDGGLGVNTITGNNTVNAWNISSANAGSLNAVPFNNIANLTGGTANDTFTIAAAGAISGTMNGGSGADVLDLTAKTSPVLVDLLAKTAPGVGVILNLDRFDAPSTGGDILRGLDTANSFKLLGVDSGTIGTSLFSSFENLVGGAGNDIFTLTPTASLTGGSISGGGGANTLTGANIASNWNLTGSGSGDVNGLPFSGINNITGGTANDTFLLAAAGAISGTLNGSSGADVLDLTAKTSPVVVDLLAKTAPGVGVILNLERFDAPSTGGDILRGLDTANSFKLLGVDSGTIGATLFSSFENLVGGAGNDIFTLTPTASLTGGSISGGGGTNTLTGANIASNWNLTGSGSGDVNGLPFNGMNNITAGTANDVVNLAATGSLSGLLNPGAGDNTLSYSAWTSDVNINAPANTATALGSVTGAYLTTLIGGAGNDTIVSSASKASVLVGNAGNDSLTGNGQRDILLGGIGSDSLTGAAADDLLFGGTTGYENNATALLSLLAEWKGPSTYASRIDHLRGSVAGGLNGTTVLANNPIDTLFDDGEIDTLTSGLGRDWFIAALNDLVIDRITSGSLVETQEAP